MIVCSRPRAIMVCHSFRSTASSPTSLLITTLFIFTNNATAASIVDHGGSAKQASLQSEDTPSKKPVDPLVGSQRLPHRPVLMRSDSVVAAGNATNATGVGTLQQLTHSGRHEEWDEEERSLLVRSWAAPVGQGPVGGANVIGGGPTGAAQPAGAAGAAAPAGAALGPDGQPLNQNWPPTLVDPNQPFCPNPPAGTPRNYCPVKRWTQESINLFGLTGHNMYTCMKDSTDPMYREQGLNQLAQCAPDPHFPRDGAYLVKQVDGTSLNMVYRLYVNGKCKINCEGIRWGGLIKWVPQVKEIQCQHRNPCVEENNCPADDPNGQIGLAQIHPSWERGLKIEAPEKMCTVPTMLYIYIIGLVCALGGFCALVASFRGFQKKFSGRNEDEWRD